MTSCPGWVPGAAGPTRAALTGFVDLHTHPLSNLGFGGKLVYGGVDVGALLPMDPDCRKMVRATSEAEALGHDHAVHGAWAADNLCGNVPREAIIHALQKMLNGADPPSDAYGFPNFQHWPVWDDLTHQKMWGEWIRRSFNGGLRVMVALAVNNKTLAGLVSGTDALSTNDKDSANLQIDEIKRFVAASNFMEIALNAEDIARITSIPKLAVVIGVEIDHMGDLQTTSPNGVKVPTAAEVKAEIHRLYDRGVRYIFPIHLLDNALGGTAAYEDLFNISNLLESGAPWALKCADPGEQITYRYQSEAAVVSLFLGNIAGLLVPGPGPDCPSPMPGGQRNSLGLTATGIEAIREMMRLGMLIDVDHMSQDSVNRTLQLAEAVGYPINSGHNNVRGATSETMSERFLTAKQYQRIGALHGMAGVGSSAIDALAWLALYTQVTTAMGPGAVGAFGTDTNGFARGMPPRNPQPTMAVPGLAACKAACPCEVDSDGHPNAACASCTTACDNRPKVCSDHCEPPPAVTYGTAPSALPVPMDGAKTWNYNTDGVAHYGMLPDFLMDVGALPGGAAVVANINTGTQYFYETWKKAEGMRGQVSCDPGLTNCGGGTCVDLMLDSTNCSACGTHCAAAMTCKSGGCLCQAPSITCEGVCVDAGSDQNNCGHCGRACPAKQLCDHGVCRADL